MSIGFFYSGTGTSVHPEKSLGGAISSYEVVGLFDDLTHKQGRAGYVDYRCIYLKNTGGKVRNAKFFVDWEQKSGSYIDIGIPVRNEIQTVEVKGPNPPKEDDTMTLKVPAYTDEFVIPYHVNITEWQGRFQTAIRAVDGLQDVIVGVAGEIGFPTDVVFTISFIGQASSRKLDLITISNNNMTGQSISITQTKEGSPISVITCSVPSVTTAPTCTSFEYPLRGNPIELGTLLKDEEFAVWLRRTTPTGTRLKLTDKVRLVVDGTSP